MEPHLLTADERVLFRRLSVFAGGWSLEAAEAVCSAPGLDPERIVDLLARLVDKSLVLVQERSGVARYRYLESVRQFALQTLLAAGEEQDARARHLAWFVQLVERNEPGLAGPEEIVALDQLEDDHDNLRAALSWCIERRDSERALRLVGAAFRFWDRRGHYADGRKWLDDALAIGAGAPAALRGKALNASAQFRWAVGDGAAATPLAEAALAACRQAGDARGIAWARLSRSVAAYFEGQSGRAVELGEESVPAAREANDVPLLSLALSALARSWLWHTGPDDPRVKVALEESLTLAEQAGSRHAASQALATLGDLAWRASDARRAMTLWQRALELRRELQDRRGTAVALERLARAAAEIGEPERAARLFGAAETQRAQIGTTLRLDEQVDRDRAIESIRSVLGDPTFEATWARGKMLALADATADALQAAAQATAPETAALTDGARIHGLTQREAQVLRLIAEGMTNAEIADLLVVSPRTVKRHLENIFDKLGVSSRSAATALAFRMRIA